MIAITWYGVVRSLHMRMIPTAKTGLRLCSENSCNILNHRGKDTKIPAGIAFDAMNRQNN